MYYTGNYFSPFIGMQINVKLHKNLHFMFFSCAEMDVNSTVGFVLYQNDKLFPSKHEKKLGVRKTIISASISGARANVEFSFNQQVIFFHNISQ